MEKMELDIERSKAVFTENRRIIFAKECYQNIYRLAMRHYDEFLNGEWRVAYGYMDSDIPGLMVRHCYLLDRRDRVIDPTIAAAEEKLKSDYGITNKSCPGYYSMHIFPTIKDYLGALIEDQQFDLDLLLKPDESCARRWAQDNGVILVG